MKRTLVVALALVLAATLCWAVAGTVTTTENTHRSVKKVVFAWTSGTLAESGTAAATTTQAYDGQVIGLTTIPGTGGDAPSLNYDVTVADADGHDVLIGAGLNRSDTATEHVASASLAGVAGSTLTLSVSGAGDANKGTVIVFIR